MWYTNRGWNLEADVDDDTENIWIRMYYDSGSTMITVIEFSFWSGSAACLGQVVDILIPLTSSSIIW